MTGSNATTLSCPGLTSEVWKRKIGTSRMCLEHCQNLVYQPCTIQNSKVRTQFLKHHMWCSIYFNMLKDAFACYMASKTMLLDPDLPPQMFEFTADRCGLRQIGLPSLPHQSMRQTAPSFSIVTWRLNGSLVESLASLNKDEIPKELIWFAPDSKNVLLAEGDVGAISRIHATGQLWQAFFAELSPIWERYLQDATIYKWQTYVRSKIL